MYNEEQVKGESGAETMQRVFGSRINLIKGDNARIIGWGKMHDALKPYTDQHGVKTARFQVTENCRHFIRTIPGLIHDDGKPEDLNSDGEDHVVDEARYVLMSRPIIPDLPKPEPTQAETFWNRVHEDISRIQQEREEEESGFRAV
jgi:hypothetical protein